MPLSSLADCFGHTDSDCLGTAWVLLGPVGHRGQEGPLRPGPGEGSGGAGAQMGTQCPVGWAVVGHPPCLPVETPLCWGAEAPSLLQTPFPGGPPLSTREARARVSCSSLGPQRLPLVRARPRCLLAITARPSSLPHPVPRLALSVSTPQGPPGCPAPSSRDTCYCPLRFTSQLRGWSCASTW